MTNNAADKQIKIQFRTARILCRRGIPPSEIPALMSHPLLSNFSTLILPYNSKTVASLVGDESVIFAKSYAQVETLVRPQVVSPKSCELKLGRQRPYRLMGRFSKQERDIVIGKAKAASLSVNEFVRASLLASDYRPPKDPDLVRALLALNRELTAQGNNLNQIAHQRNAAQISDAQANSMLDILGRSLLRAHKAVRDALSRGLAPEP